MERIKGTELLQKRYGGRTKEAERKGRRKGKVSGIIAVDPVCIFIRCLLLKLFLPIQASLRVLNCRKLVSWRHCRSPGRTSTEDGYSLRNYIGDILGIMENKMENNMETVNHAWPVAQIPLRSVPSCMSPAARMTAWSSCTIQEVYRLAWPLLPGCQHGLWLKSKQLPPPPMEGRARVRVRVSSVLDVQAGVAFKVSGDEVRRVGFRCKGHGNLPSPYSL